MRVLRSAAFAGFAALGAVGPLSAQTGLLVVAHGASPQWNNGVRQVVEQVQWSGPVATAFLMGDEAETSGWNAAVAQLVQRGVREIVVVPMMVSSHGEHYRQIQFYAGEISQLPAGMAEHQHGAIVSPPVPMRVTAALDASPELGAALLDRWQGLSEVDRRRPLVLVAHGPSSDDEAALWISDLSAVAAGIRVQGRIPVAVGLLRDDAAPPVRAAAVSQTRGLIEQFAAESRDSVAAISVLISTGSIATVTIPEDLAGLPVRYTPVVLTPLAPLARWVERMALAKMETVR